MRLHILGICGTFMSGLAILAKQAGHDVSGSDDQMYPPMSDQLAHQGIALQKGYHPSHIDPDVDCVIVGNIIKRGNPAIEWVLNQQIPYLSGPEWLAKNVLNQRWVLGVAGTHGKTTTTSILTWLLESAGFKPGFMIGGIPENFNVSARLGNAPYFVIEADEYDSAFFDKRSKFIHYHPKTLILNNLEYDHADIFPNLDAIKQQFRFLIRTIPGNGQIIYNGEDAHLGQVIQSGCWTKTISFGNKVDSAWQANIINPDGTYFEVKHAGKLIGEVKWSLVGVHNVYNALAALAAADQVNVPVDIAINALQTFKNVKRRLEVKAIVNDIVVYDDFAHHPTAIATTLAGLRAKIGKAARMIAVLEFGSYTMRNGVHKENLSIALKNADMVFCKSTESDWGLEQVLNTFSQPTVACPDVDSLIKQLVPTLRAGDHIIVMSNTAFGGIHHKLIQAINDGAGMDG